MGQGGHTLRSISDPVYPQQMLEQKDTRWSLCKTAQKLESSLITVAVAVVVILLILLLSL